MTHHYHETLVVTNTDLKKLHDLLDAATKHISIKEDNELLAHLKITVGLNGDNSSNRFNITATKLSLSMRLKKNSLTAIINNLAK